MPDDSFKPTPLRGAGTPPPGTAVTRAIGLGVALCLCFAVAALGARASVDAGSFYMQLQRPAWAPPAWVFGPVWTVLYALMAVSAWLVWRRYRFRGAALPLALFASQLALNGLWSWVFFQWHKGFLATVNVAVLWAVLLATLLAFWRKHRLAASLLLPYLAWVTFAAALTYVVWRLNPQFLGGLDHAA